MQNYYYEHKCDELHSIEICYPNQTRDCLKRFLTNKLGSKESNAILNNIILGEPSYTFGELTIINRPNIIVNIKDSRSYLYIKKRVMSKDEYIDYFFKYNFCKEKYQIKVIKNMQGNHKDITDLFLENEVVKELILELEVLDVMPNITIITEYLCIVNGRLGLCEITGEEISLYSSRKETENLDEVTRQRYMIIKNDTKEAIGYVMFTFDGTNIAYAINKPYQGHYYASKALKLMIELIKNNINFQESNLYVCIYKDNLASIKTAERCQLEKVKDDGLFREYVVNPQKILTVK